MRPYLTVGVVAFLVTYLTTPAVIRLARMLGAIDQPNDRKVHATPTPTLGGLAIFLGIMAAGALATRLPYFDGVFTQSSQMVGILGGAVVIFALGAVDDLKDLPAPVKLAGQVFAAGILFLAGVKMQWILLPNGEVFSVSDDVSVLLTVGWMVAMINAVNLIDGLDGLAAGLVAIAASAFFVYTFQLSLNQGSGAVVFFAPAPLLAMALVGATLGFLRYNFHPARVFMGDSGSMLLGLVLGGATVAGISSSSGFSAFPGDGASSSQVFLAYSPLIIPLLVLALPIADAMLAIVRRARRRTSVFHADKEHLHHRLMDLGHGHRQAVLVMYIWAALAAGAGLAFTYLDRNDVIFALPVLVGAIVLYTLFPLLTKVVQDRLAP